MAKPRPTPLPIVEVTWLDANNRAICVTLPEAKKQGELCERRTVGYLVSRGRNKVVLATTFDPAEPNEEDHVDDVYTIPSKWVVRWRRLR